jgi:hypothetical protein
LSEFDFVVEHRTGSKIPHADALSRHVGAVTHNGCPNKATVLQEQAKDAFCAKQDHGTFTSRKEFFVDNEGVMYRRQRNGKHQ